jgi:hypothetical protein
MVAMGFSNVQYINQNKTEVNMCRKKHKGWKRKKREWWKRKGREENGKDVKGRGKKGERKEKEWK